MSGYTPGPWSVVEHDHAICVQTESQKKTKFGASRYAAIGGFDRSDQAQLAEARANARLIAAAPDLLEALQLCRQHMYNQASNTPDNAFEKLCAAIAKATETRP